MDEELEVLRGYVESLGLHEKTELTSQDKADLVESLRDADETTLATYINNLSSPTELLDLIVNTLYG